MTMHAQPIYALVPGVGPFIGDAPQDRHAERVVREALDVWSRHLLERADFKSVWL